MATTDSVRARASLRTFASTTTLGRRTAGGRVFGRIQRDLKPMRHARNNVHTSRAAWPLGLFSDFMRQPSARPDYLKTMVMGSV
jgi:hypothetical protein